MLLWDQRCVPVLECSLFPFIWVLEPSQDGAFPGISAHLLLAQAVGLDPLRTHGGKESILTAAPIGWQWGGHGDSMTVGNP